MGKGRQVGEEGRVSTVPHLLFDRPGNEAVIPGGKAGK